MNVGLLLEMAADGGADRVAVGSRVDGTTYGTLLQRARALAGRLQAAGYERLGHVALNSDVLPLSLFGAGLAGVPFAPLNYRLPAEQLRALAARLAPGLVVADPDRVADLRCAREGDRPGGASAGEVGVVGGPDGDRAHQAAWTEASTRMLAPE